MKVLLTGARGQVGAAVCRLAQEYPLEIVPFGAEDLDITDALAIGRVLAAESPAIIVNTAAYTAVDAAEDHEEQAMAVNAEGVKNLAKAASSKDIPLIHISTDYVFDGSSKKPYAETAEVNPLGVYGRSKRLGEEHALETLGRLVILRTSWVFGLEGNNFPKTMLRLAGEREEIGVVADQFGCPTFADDLATVILQLCSQFGESGELPWGLYHYCGSETCSWHQLAEFTLGRAAQRGILKNTIKINKLSTDEYPTKAPRPQYSVLECQKFRINFPACSLSDWKAGILRLLESVSPQAK